MRINQINKCYKALLRAFNDYVLTEIKPLKTSVIQIDLKNIPLPVVSSQFF